jgi:1,4-alpha-glucan branching enzyme
MGQEFAQFQEWSEKRQLDWWLLGETKNREMQHFVKSLNRLYREYDAMYYNDHDPIGFEWMGCDDNERSIISFVRRGSTQDRQLLFVYNFTPVVRENYRCGVPCLGKYKEILNSDRSEFGGHNIINPEPIEAEDIPCEKGSASIEFTLPGLSVVIFEYDSSRQSVEKAKKRIEKLKLKKEKSEKELIRSETEKK